MGAFVTVAKTGVPVNPTAIRGVHSMLRDDSGFPRPGTITVTIGKTIKFGLVSEAKSKIFYR